MKKPYLEEQLKAKVELDQKQLDSIAEQEKKRKLEEQVTRAKERLRTEGEHGLARQRLQWAGKNHELPESARRILLGITALSGLWAAVSLWMWLKWGFAGFFEIVSFLGFDERPFVLGLLQAALLANLFWLVRLGMFHSSLDNQIWFTGLPEHEKARALATLTSAHRRLHVAQLLFCILGVMFGASLFGWEPALSYLLGFGRAWLALAVAGVVTRVGVWFFF